MTLSPQNPWFSGKLAIFERYKVTILLEMGPIFDRTMIMGGSVPGKSAGDLFWMVSSHDPFQWLLVTSNDRG